jgi:putative hydrolase
MGGFLPNMLGDLLRLLKTDAPFPFEVAQQLAESIAGADSPAPVDPLDRMRLEELVQIADLQVADVTGMTTGVGGRPVAVTPLARVDWARANLLAWREALEAFATELRPKPESTPSSPPREDAFGDDFGGEPDVGALIGQWAQAVAPAMIAMQFGSMVGHLATSTLGQYDLVLPRKNEGELTVVPQNIAAFAEDWSLKRDDVAFYLMVRDVTLQAIVARPHVMERLRALMLEHAKGFRPDPAALESALGESSLSGAPNLEEISQLLGSPAALGRIADTPEQRRVAADLASLAAAIGGYAEWVTRTVAERTIGTGTPIAAALRRHRLGRSENERVADALFGLAIDQAAIDRGDAFVRGVLERGAERELASLFVIPEHLPTPAEIDAPGLWIERINLPPAEPPTN